MELLKYMFRTMVSNHYIILSFIQYFHEILKHSLNSMLQLEGLNPPSTKYCSMYRYVCSTEHFFELSSYFDAYFRFSIT